MSKAERSFRIVLYWIGLISLAIILHDVSFWVMIPIVFVYAVIMGAFNVWCLPSLYKDVKDG